MISRLLLIAALLGCAAMARGEVIAVSSDGFVSAHQITIAGSPAHVYRALTREIGQWWDPAHSYSGNSENFSLTARAGGCFCETLPDGGSVEHMRVVYAAPDNLLRLAGGLGPLQGMGVSGTMTFTLTESEGGNTALDYRYAVSGFSPDGWQPIAEAVDQVQLGQLQRLRSFVEESEQ